MHVRPVSGLAAGTGEDHHSAGADFVHAPVGRGVVGRVTWRGPPASAKRMNVIVDLCLVPLGAGGSLSPYVAACERVLAAAGLTIELHANGTNIEGDWDTVFSAVKECHEEVHRMGAVRIFSVIKVGTRIDRAQTLSDKVESVRSKLRGNGGDAGSAPAQ